MISPMLVLPALNAPKFRRSMEQELVAMKNVLHSEHCKRSMTRAPVSLSRQVHQGEEQGGHE